MTSLLVDLVLTAVAVFAVAELLPGVKCKSFGTALIVALVYSIINAVLFWVLAILTLPLIMITLGLFMIILNAFLLWLTDKLIEDFEISSFGMTIIASICITIIFKVLSVAVGIIL